MFKKTDLCCVVDYDYDRSSCTCDDDICRCRTIQNARVENICISEVVKALYHRYGGKDSNRIDMYCFDRACHARRIYDKDLYKIETCCGYYGEEIDGVYFEEEEKIFNDYQGMLALTTPIEKIQYCLTLEYGYLLDCVRSATSAHVVEVPFNKIHIPQREYFIKLDNNAIEEYKNRSLPVAVCGKSDFGYKLIDGYHRYVSNKDRSTVEIVVLE